MFCYQCQETAQGKGCTLKGVCGKTAEVAGLQDLLMYLMKGISKLTTTLRKQGVESSTANKFIVDGLFMTITNANFDSSRFVSKIKGSLSATGEPSQRIASTGNPSFLNLRLSDLEIG